MRKKLIFCCLILLSLTMMACTSSQNAEIVCNECKNKIAEDSTFCSSCGSQVVVTDSNDKNSDANEEAEKDISFIIEILSSNKTKVKSTYDAVSSGTDLTLAGSFLGLEGEYRICCDDESIWRVIFKHDNENYDSDTMVNSISQVLGKYDLYDVEWNEYEWHTDTLEIMFYVDERIYFNLAFEPPNETPEHVHEAEWTEWDENYDKAEYERNLICLSCDETIDTETKDMTTYVNGDVFSIYPYAFADRFDEQSKRLSGIEFESVVEYTYGDDIMYYLSDDNTIYYRVKEGSSDIGIYNFYNIDGKALSRQDDFAENEIARIDILVEDSYNLAAVIYTTLLAIDPSMDYSYAAEFGQSLQDNLVIAVGELEEGALNGVDYNGINYLVYRDRDYHYVIVKPALGSTEEVTE